MSAPASSTRENVSKPPSQAAASIVMVSSDDVLGGRQELHICHGTAIYTLRVTRQGKLILTK